MRVTYEATFTARCPVDDTRDIYSLTVSSYKTIPVEQILTAINEATASAAYQEDITILLAQAFPAAEVVTVGAHSGVRTTAKC